MATRYYKTGAGAVDLNEVIGIHGDSYHSKFALRGGASLTLEGDARVATKVWFDYIDERDRTNQNSNEKQNSLRNWVPTGN